MHQSLYNSLAKTYKVDYNPLNSQSKSNHSFVQKSGPKKVATAHTLSVANSRLKKQLYIKSFQAHSNNRISRDGIRKSLDIYDAKDIYGNNRSAFKSLNSFEGSYENRPGKRFV
jgi:hypothetical protein